MTPISRRALLCKTSAVCVLALSGCGGQISQDLTPEETRRAPDGRPIATTRAEPLSEHAARFGITPISYDSRPDGAHTLPAVGMSLIAPEFHRQVVAYQSPHPPGTIVIDNTARHLFLVLPDGFALRYGIAVGRTGLTWRGSGTIYRRAEWPAWTPTARMIRADPSLARYATGMPGGPRNPLGARALYLRSGGRDFGYRIHGTPEYWRIGEYVSSGCIRMINHDVIDLYERVSIGTRVVTT